MTCETAAPFVSMMCDGEAVPEEVSRHIGSCEHCQEQLRDWAAVGGALRLAAAVDRLEPLPALELGESNAAPEKRRDGLWRAWMSPVRVPRAAAAIATCGIFVTSVGWFRAQTAQTELRAFHALDYSVSFGCPNAGDPSSPASHGRARVGSTSSFQTSDTCLPDGFDLFYTVNPVALKDSVVTLRLGVAAVRKESFDFGGIKDAFAGVKQYDYVSGQSLVFPMPGGSKVTFKATLIEGFDSFQASVSMASLLPKPDELLVTAPALIRDSTTLLMTMNAAATSKAGQVTAIYAPGDGLFLIGLRQFEGARPAEIGGSILSFEDAGHRYALYSSLPMTGGNQPATVWVRHVAGFRPSGRTDSPWRDDYPGISSGDLSAYVK